MRVNVSGSIPGLRGKHQAARPACPPFAALDQSFTFQEVSLAVHTGIPVDEAECCGGVTEDVRLGKPDGWSVARLVKLQAALTDDPVQCRWPSLCSDRCISARMVRARTALGVFKSEFQNLEGDSECCPIPSTHHGSLKSYMGHANREH